jgi:hypothetical protein
LPRGASFVLGWAQRISSAIEPAVAAAAEPRRLPREFVLDVPLDPDALLHHATSRSTGIPPFELTNEVMDAAGGWVEEFQIAKVLADKFVVRVVGIREAEHDDVVRLRTALLSILPSTIRLDIQQVQEIERDASGKLHYCRALHRPVSQGTAKP